MCVNVCVCVVRLCVFVYVVGSLTTQAETANWRGGASLQNYIAKANVQCIYIYMFSCGVSEYTGRDSKLEGWGQFARQHAACTKHAACVLERTKHAACTNHAACAHTNVCVGPCTHNSYIEPRIEQFSPPRDSSAWLKAEVGPGENQCQT